MSTVRGEYGGWVPGAEEDAAVQFPAEEPARPTGKDDHHEGPTAGSESRMREPVHPDSANRTEPNHLTITQVPANRRST